MYQTPIAPPPPSEDARDSTAPAETARPARRFRPGRWAVLLVVLAAAGYGGWRAWSADEATLLRPPSAPVTVGDVEVNVLATGMLKPSKLVAVGSQASGRITDLPVSVGDTVKRGDLIATIDSTRQENDLKTSEATLAATRAQLVEKQATLLNEKKTLERQRTLAARNTIAASDLDTAEAAVAVTEAQIEATGAQIEAARVAVESAKVNLGYTRITAPMDGTVLAVVAQQGQTVNATQSAPTIVVLGDLSTMTIHAEISEADVVRARPGQPVWFTILGDPDTPHPATLSSIAPAPDSVVDDQMLTGSTSDASSEAIYYNGLFTVPNPDGELRTYMTAQVRVVIDRAEGVLTVPASALGQRREDGLTEIGVLGADGAVEWRWVEVGLNDRDRAEVRSGLTEGERVVLGAGTAADDGQQGSAARRAAARMPPPPMGL
ncbi:efflux RND transporter periplasmic adaptor subunit [Amaricoccus solimangrovi]|uniref:Efflux RND transporter periplasmic adaptor subunit n=1 Tax=Amaricoccus solimangrovi TaxID=2589815 RepID=A0A501WRX6_9RHOB|nr:efflux RND transporter periplasmic adaptor subunit [Amaricoccus solimangrovi]TPE48526.1 efflux RND transporter periplasmic adaptor subunit [Amaricoccus solimangrovi]